jgi:cellulose synthase/poly-beta-1,6-N-acetylglucosamine synthase-like glycosyltransferase
MWPGAVFMMLTWTIRALAAAVVVSTVPLFFDLAVALLGNLLTRSAPVPACPVAPAGQATLAGQGSQPRLAVIVPAHDEQTMIARTVHSLLIAGCSPADRPASSQTSTAQPGPAFSSNVFVVAHNCSDQTAVEALRAGAVVVELDDPLAHGKGAALRAGFRAALAAGADAFLVIDADSVVSPNLLAAMRHALASGAAAAQCRYELELGPGPGLQPRARLRALAFRGMNVLRARGRATLGESAGLFGNGFALTAETLARVPYEANSICEDLEYHIYLVSAGINVVWVEQALVQAPLSRPGAVQATQEARWEGGRFRAASIASARLVRRALRGSWPAVGLLAEAWSLPLSRGLLLLLFAALLPLGWLHAYALACLLVTVGYVAGAALLGAAPRSDLAALVCAPAHIFWKAAMTPLVLRQARRRAEWARTDREDRRG